jgi:hypothetical protein
MIMKNLPIPKANEEWSGSGTKPVLSSTRICKKSGGSIDSKVTYTPGQDPGFRAVFGQIMGFNYKTLNE